MGCTKLDIYTGVDFDITFYWNDAEAKPIDVTTFTAYMQIKERIDSLEIYFNASPYLYINGEDAINGAVRLNIPASATSNLQKLTNGVFDIKLKSQSGNIYMLLDGSVNIHKTITEIP